ncbi:hypothetical protein OIU76_023184 [Salix suchowensis]|uniref:Uncharacterized protein n=1 Tax=Salix suchowensis TaxID=1278906 RepID=A0ABQ8ZSI0_9ROSI|nr:hypothetical protein OIU76_023184 [Salix suchowensis]KAJ6309367.1 hypothetical protein OIU77_015170 [Salix suchowensis]
MGLRGRYDDWFLSEARSGTLLREGRLVSRASRDFVDFGPPNPATDEKALWSKGKRVRCHAPGLPKVPTTNIRRGSSFVTIIINIIIVIMIVMVGSALKPSTNTVH